MLPPLVVPLLAKLSGPAGTDLLSHLRFLKLAGLLEQFLRHDLLDSSHDLEHSVAHLGVVGEVEACLLGHFLLLHFPQPADGIPQAGLRSSLDLLDRVLLDLLGDLFGARALPILRASLTFIGVCPLLELLSDGVLALNDAFGYLFVAFLEKLGRCVVQRLGSSGVFLVPGRLCLGRVSIDEPSPCFFLGRQFEQVLAVVAGEGLRLVDEPLLDVEILHEHPLMEHHLGSSHLFRGFLSSGFLVDCCFFLGRGRRSHFGGLALGDVRGLVGVTPGIELNLGRGSPFRHSEAGHVEAFLFEELGQGCNFLRLFERMVYLDVELVFFSSFIFRRLLPP